MLSNFIPPDLVRINVYINYLRGSFKLKREENTSTGNWKNIFDKNGMLVCALTVELPAITVFGSFP